MAIEVVTNKKIYLLISFIGIITLIVVAALDSVLNISSELPNVLTAISFLSSMIFWTGVVGFISLKYSPQHFKKIMIIWIVGFCLVGCIGALVISWFILF